MDEGIIRRGIDRDTDARRSDVLVLRGHRASSGRKREIGDVLLQVLGQVSGRKTRKLPCTHAVHRRLP